ncbi:MAG TPA: GAF domain-containing sensor histidine kinase [Chloroflexota bacterium]|nr:GAF domain-containing sensor histidine kinase [Chloroflexota bacterium]
MSVTTFAADLRGIAEVAAALTAEADLGGILTKIVRAAAQSLGNLQHNAILLLEEDGRHLRHTASMGLPRSYLESIDGAEIGPHAGTCGVAAYTGRTVLTEDLMTDPDWDLYRHLAAPHGLRAVWSVPLIGEGGRVLGAFSAYSTRPGLPTGHQLEMLGLYARLASTAVEHVLAQRAERTLKDALQASEARLQAVVASAPVLVWAVDRDGVFTMQEGALLARLGLVSGARVGQSIWEVMDSQPGVEDIRRLMAGEVTTISGPYRGLVIESQCTLTRDGQGEVTGMIVVSIDVTERAREQADAEGARRAAEDLARLRSDFVAAASHELRTPLAAIIGYTELLTTHWDRFDDAQRLERLRRIAVSAERQHRLVNDLVLAGLLDREHFTISTESLSLINLARHAADEVRASYRGQRIDLEGPDDLWMLADAGRAAQVLANLVDNAAKYSPEETKITLSWGAESGYAVVRVRDQGTGIPEDGRDHIFTRFGRVAGSRSRSGRVGTGLGLYLGRRLAEIMGGDLVLETTGARGSTFRLRLPLAEIPG